MNTEVSVEDVEAALMEHEEIRAVVIVSPTYDGVVSDIEAIAAAVHAKGIPLIVDEAHGAHFGFHPYFPNRALSLGADLVINSLHKTLPSLTQTAIIHMNGEIVDREKVRRYLHMLQSSSPSYVLMASIDACISLMKNDGRELFARYVAWLEETREKLKSLKCLKLIETEHYDRSKILISVADTELTSHELSRRLREEYQLDSGKIYPGDDFRGRYQGRIRPFGNGSVRNRWNADSRDGERDRCCYNRSRLRH